MARQARIVIPGLPHHVTQRGNRRQKVFFDAEDYAAYLALLAAHCRAAGVAIWSYCLMPNHIHLIAVPSGRESLRAGIAEAHRRYTRRVNFHEGWRGHLWQERFHSFAMDEDWLLACARYVALNPVRAGLVTRPEDWPWSSARAHLEGRSDGVVELAGLAERVGDWDEFLSLSLGEAELNRLRLHGRTGRVLGADAFVAAWEEKLGRRLKALPVGRPRKAEKTD